MMIIDRPLDTFLVGEQNNDDDIEEIIAESNIDAVTPYNPPLTPTAYWVTLNTIWPFPRRELWGRRFHLYSDVYDELRHTAIPNYIGARIPVQSGLHIKAWRLLLKDYYDSQLLDFLQFGWPVDYTGEKPSGACA